MSPNAEAMGHSYAGGDDGGRIAILSCHVLMSPDLITTTGGSGYANGADGIVFYGSAAVEITRQLDAAASSFLRRCSRRPARRGRCVARDRVETLQVLHPPRRFLRFS